MQFIKFGLVGVSNAVVSMAVYSGLVYFGAHYIIANVFAFILSVLNAYFWNSRFVFIQNEDEFRNPLFSLIKTYISYGFTGIILQSLFLFVFIDKMAINKYLAQILCIVINLPLNFILNKFWSFKIDKNEVKR